MKILKVLVFLLALFVLSSAQAKNPDAKKSNETGSGNNSTGEGIAAKNDTELDKEIQMILTEFTSMSKPSNERDREQYDIIQKLRKDNASEAEKQKVIDEWLAFKKRRQNVDESIANEAEKLKKKLSNHLTESEKERINERLEALEMMKKESSVVGEVMLKYYNKYLLAPGSTSSSSPHSPTSSSSPHSPTTASSTTTQVDQSQILKDILAAIQKISENSSTGSGTTNNTDKVVEYYMKVIDRWLCLLEKSYDDDEDDWDFWDIFNWW